MKITVIGTGYVGLVTGACLAEMGNDVVCLDIDQEKINMLRAGSVPIYEPGLEAIVHSNQEAGRLRFTCDIAESVAHGLVQFIAVGTPPDEDGAADLKYVLGAAHNIAQNMSDHKVIVDKSTVPVGTASRVLSVITNVLQSRGVDLEFSVISNPEFLKEGSAVEDFMRPHRIIIGADDEKGAQIMRTLYAPFQRNHDRTIFMDIRSAELTKYAANAMLATRISFMNELAMLSEKLGADIEQVRLGLGADPRIGPHFLYAGCGFGGSCFPKDVAALVRTAHTVDIDLRILQAVQSVNHRQKLVMIDKIISRLGTDLSGRRFALWGLAFKPNTDDMREAPSRALIEKLWQHGAHVVAYDPVAMTECRRIYGHDKPLELADSAMAALDGADGLIIVTEWQIFRSPDFDAIQKRLKSPIIFDGRNLYDPDIVQRHGLEYISIGRSMNTERFVG